MKMKILLLLLAAALMLSSCAKNVEGGSDTVRDGGVPDNILPPATEAETVSEPETEPTEPETEPIVTEQSVSETEPSKTSETDDSGEEPIMTDPVSETKTYEYLRLLNSDKIHAKFSIISSFDGEYMIDSTMEIFTDGDKRIYIDDSSKTMISDGVVTVVNYADGVYYSYPDEGDYGLNFGYDISLYSLISSEESDGELSETFEIEDRGLTSEWTFGSDGSVRVADRSLDGSFFELYTFEVIENDVSKMDFSVPDGFGEGNAEDYGLFV